MIATLLRTSSQTSTHKSILELNEKLKCLWLYALIHTHPPQTSMPPYIRPTIAGFFPSGIDTWCN